MLRLVLGAGLVLAAATAAVAAPCTADHATYAIDGDANHRLAFSRAHEPNAWSNLAVTLESPARTLEFGLTASNGYSFNYLVPAWSGAPEDTSFHVFFFDRDLKVSGLPQAGDPPPPFVFAPDLGSYLWYDPAAADRDYLPVGMWRFTGCSG